VDPATAMAAPVLLYHQWWPFGYRQPPVEGNPALTTGCAQTARGSMEPRSRPARRRLASPTCVRCRLCPTGGRYQDCAGAEAADSVSAVEPMDLFAGQSLGPMLQEGQVSDSETLRPAATNTLRSISHLARLPASSGHYERNARTLSPRCHNSLFTRPYEWRRAETMLHVNDSVRHNETLRNAHLWTCKSVG
jgi:hypothetical protein